MQHMSYLLSHISICNRYYHEYLPPANEVCEGYVLTGVCLSRGGACMVAGGAWLLAGVHGCRGTCVVAWGAFMVAGGMHSCRGAAWLRVGMRRLRQDTVNEQAVHILLECILVYYATGQGQFSFSWANLPDLANINCTFYQLLSFIFFRKEPFKASNYW